ncbi:hypothetical protein ACLOJK_026993 [Asimina triloba]
MAATAATAGDATVRRRHRSKPAVPPAAAARHASSPSHAVNEEEDDAVVVLIDTHHRRASQRAIQATHHDGDDAHIPDLLRSQADVDHRGHTRRVFLARHQQIQLYPAPIVAHFKSKSSHLLIHIFMDHSTDLDPRMDQRQRSTKRFLPELIRPSILPNASVFVSIISKAWISRSRPFIISAITARAAHVPTATARAAHVPPPVLHAATSPPSPPLPSHARCPRPLPLHRHHPPAARTVHQRPRLLGPSRQQSTARLMQLAYNKI